MPRLPVMLIGTVKRVGNHLEVACGEGLVPPEVQIGERVYAVGHESLSELLGAEVRVCEAGCVWLEGEDDGPWGGDEDADLCPDCTAESIAAGGNSAGTRGPMRRRRRR